MTTPLSKLSKIEQPHQPIRLPSPLPPTIFERMLSEMEKQTLILLQLRYALFEALQIRVDDVSSKEKERGIMTTAKNISLLQEGEAIFTPFQKTQLAKAGSGLKSFRLPCGHAVLQKPEGARSSPKARLSCPLRRWLCPQCRESIFGSTAKRGIR